MKEKPNGVNSSWEMVREKFINLSKNVYFIRTLLFVFFVISLTFILSWKYFPSKPYSQGLVSSKDILAPFSFEVENEAETLKAQSRAMNSVEYVYRIDPLVLNRVSSQLKTQFTLFRKLKIAYKRKEHVKVKDLKAQLPVSISDSSLHVFLKISNINRQHMEILIKDLVNQSMGEIIKEGDREELKKIRAKIRRNSQSLKLLSSQRDAVADLASEAIQPNAFIDNEKTSLLRQQKKDSVKPVMIKIKKGQIIVNKGEIITPEDIRILEKMGIQRFRFNVMGFLGIFIFVLLFTFITWRFLKLWTPDISKNIKILQLLILIIISNVLLSSLLVQLNPYWAPIPIASMLIAILVHPGIALVITLFLSIIIGIFTGDFQYVAVPLITGAVSVISVWNIRRRLDIITASIVVFIVNVLSVTLFSLFKGDFTPVIRESLVYAGINGFSSGVIVIGLLPLLEYGFHITTAIKLLELSNQSEPLLRRLLLEAPGTYHHSVIVGNLAEAGAEVVGEDPLLCRVGSYYHDIGKLERPYFFIENQLGSENPHEKLSPNLSALIITAHTKDGLFLGKKHCLPKPILDIIIQHHSNSMTAFFYHKAIQENISKSVKGEDFRYPGPKPQTKASAIVMLADSVEAAARTLQDPTPQKLETLVSSIIKKYVGEGHLDESPLSLKNLNDLVSAFTRVLTGIYHHRIEYPEDIVDKVNVSKILPKSVIKNSGNLD